KPGVSPRRVRSNRRSWLHRRVPRDGAKRSSYEAFPDPRVLPRPSPGSRTGDTLEMEAAGSAGSGRTAAPAIFLRPHRSKKIRRLDRLWAPPREAQYTSLSEANSSHYMLCWETY